MEIKRTKDGESLPIWSEGVVSPGCHLLSADRDFDVCVVGAGVAGLTTALLLAKQGKRICVLDSQDVGFGQTGRSTAQLSTALRLRYFELERLHGAKGAKLIAESHRSAIDLVEKLTDECAIECDLVRVNGYLFAAGKDDDSMLAKELAAIQRAGLVDVFLTRDVANHPFLNGREQALCFKNQIRLDPKKYSIGLAREIMRLGGQVFCQTRVEKVVGGEKASVTTQNGQTIRSSSIVIATNSPINDTYAMHTKQSPYRTYVVGLRVPRAVIPDACYWDTLDPYHYVRLYDETTVLVGGEDHKTGQDENPEARFDKLVAWAREKIPFAGEVVTRWSGQVMESVDGIGYAGHNPLDRRNVYVITGDCGNGITHGTLGARIVADQISGQTNPWESLYSPSRKSLRSASAFVMENSNVAVQYLYWVKPLHSRDLDLLERGEGAVVREGVSFVAAYRDPQGHISKCSAVCPHLEAIVRWNSAEKTWDCPCHGSRFTATGQVIEGPAFSDLAPVEGNERGFDSGHSMDVMN